MIKHSTNAADYNVKTKYIINRSTKGHRTLHIYNNPKCYYSRGCFSTYEEASTVEEAMNSDPCPQKCKICFPD